MILESRTNVKSVVASNNSPGMEKKKSSTRSSSGVLGVSLRLTACAVRLKFKPVLEGCGNGLSRDLVKASKDGIEMFGGKLNDELPAIPSNCSSSNICINTARFTMN